MSKDLEGIGDNSIETFTFIVLGRPAPQGSKRHVGNGIMVESSKYVKPWRKQIKSTAENLLPGGWHATLPVHLETEFLFARPKNHFNSKGELKDSSYSTPAPRHCTSVVGDIEKLIRSVADALTGVVYEDDSQIISLKSLRRYARTHEPECVIIRITPVID